MRNLPDDTASFCVSLCSKTESHGITKCPQLRRYDNPVTNKFQNHIQIYEWLVSIGFFSVSRSSNSATMYLNTRTSMILYISPKSRILLNAFKNSRCTEVGIVWIIQGLYGTPISIFRV